MNFIKSWRADAIGDCWPLALHYNAVTVTANHLLYVIGRHIRVNVE